ncbi:helix-turn-helix domain-containing protein [Rhodococcus antarcticus]|uniref:Helix-turn-helix domain-containing protein n=1 Tax=Rhodococcus antarcticus TaxID=2987751 RepID=A0ABY6NXT1_9NOCA|nr:helix-turn-helix domain-containing protein [Rhodococcus antarcticus]UZJ24210.1 helix-turn-helix domain-containing protein [Rhodococcus antarcticus]
MPEPHPDPHPVIVAITPLVERIGATLVPAGALGPDDVALQWDGEVVGGVRLSGAERAGELADLLENLTAEMGAPLHTLDRARRQRAVRLLDERGAFQYRKSVETVAEALGVTRFTIYNYLNRDRTA